MSLECSHPLSIFITCECLYTKQLFPWCPCLLPWAGVYSRLFTRTARTGDRSTTGSRGTQIHTPQPLPGHTCPVLECPAARCACGSNHCNQPRTTRPNPSPPQATPGSNRQQHVPPNSPCRKLAIQRKKFNTTNCCPFIVGLLVAHANARVLGPHVKFG